MMGRAGRPQFDTQGIGAFSLFVSVELLTGGRSLHHDREEPSGPLRGAGELGGEQFGPLPDSSRS